jgi:hypothetical protein
MPTIIARNQYARRHSILVHDLSKVSLKVGAYVDYSNNANPVSEIPIDVMASNLPLPALLEHDRIRCSDSRVFGE